MSAFDKVIGYEKEKEELYQLCDMAKNPEKYAALGVKLPRGILLYGVPGVGKTLMATALLDEMDNGRKRYILRKDKAIEEFVESISKTFQEAKENAPSVIFLDDLDKFASDSVSRNPEELIAVQSGIDEVKGADVFVVATANDVRVLPNSLRRPGTSRQIRSHSRDLPAQPQRSGGDRAPLSEREKGCRRCYCRGRSAADGR